MAGIKTNSNSITAILVEKLNYKKSGFRNAMIKFWNLPDNIIFIDGTHSTIRLPEMQNKEVDIIGTVGSKILLLLEIKANCNENLQNSQKKNGQYQKTVECHKEIKLKYIIPDGYYHISELPDETEQIKIYTWSEIYEIAKETDNTGLIDQINYFVENNFNLNDTLLNKGEVAMFLTPSIIGKVNSLYTKTQKLMSEFIKNNGKMISQRPDYQFELGWNYTLTKDTKQINAWIGFYELKDFPKNSFFIYHWIDANNLPEFKSTNYVVNKDYIYYEYTTGDDVFVPITNENSEIPEFLFSENSKEQQTKFDELMKYNINKLFDIIS
jgi:hypothetical protein